MHHQKGTAAALIGSDGRRNACQLGGLDRRNVKPKPTQKQPDFAAAITAADGPRLAQPGWHSIAARLAREPHDDSAFAAALRRALVEREGAS